VKNLDETYSRFDMEIRAEKTKPTTNSGKQISTTTKVRQKELETVVQIYWLYNHRRGIKSRHFVTCSTNNGSYVKAKTYLERQEHLSEN